MKTCFKCEKKKPTSEFYRHPMMADGRLGKCKECAKADASANYRANIDHYVNYERERFKTPHRKAQVIAYQQKIRASKPGKTRCRNAVSNALRDGRLVKKSCEVCGNEKSEAHHDDYRKPLVVRWLCRKHHLQHHGKESRA